MKICYTSDLHGHWSHYQALAELHRRNRFDAILIGGDLLPRIGHDIHSLNRQIHFIKDQLLLLFKEFQSVKPVKILIIPGNNDWASAMPYFGLDPTANVILLNPANPEALCDGYSILGYPCVPPTPFIPKDFERKDCCFDSIAEMEGCISRQRSIQPIITSDYFAANPSIENDMDSLTPKNPDRLIFMAHSPPFQTALDRTQNGAFGSRAIRAWIEQTQPYLTLHGHIHESPEVSGKFWDRIGSSLVVNPGQNRAKLSAVLFNPEDLSTLTHTLRGPAFGDKA